MTIRRRSTSTALQRLSPVRTVTSPLPRVLRLCAATHTRLAGREQSEDKRHVIPAVLRGVRVWSIKDPLMPALSDSDIAAVAALLTALANLGSTIVALVTALRRPSNQADQQRRTSR